jgi:hypothetical protein
MIILLPALNAGCDSRSSSSGDVGRHKGLFFLVQSRPDRSNYLLLVAQPPLPLQVFLPLHP